MLKIETTSDYSIFKILNGNREVNQLHVKRLKESISKKHLITIITVNENYEIIDGQHRFNVLKDLGFPINYIIAKGYGLSEIQILNANMKNWSNLDYLQGYIDLGNANYIIFNDFTNKYKLGFQISLTLLSGIHISGNENNLLTKFKTGDFKINNLEKAIDVADKLIELKKYYDGYGRRAFVYALTFILKNKSFDFDEFINKLKQQPTSLKDCVNTTQYKELIENIYNYRRRDKINLKY